MKTYLSLAAGLAGGTLVLLSSCSKTSETSNEAIVSPTATPIVSATVTPTTSAIATISPTVSPLPSSSPFANIDRQLNDLNANLDSIFSQTFQDFGSAFGQSGLGSSVDLREQKDAYVARVYVPHGDTAGVNARVENGALHVTTQSSQTNGNASSASKSEEVVSLPLPVKADQLKIDRKPNLVVVTIPKTTPSLASTSPLPSATPTVSPNESSSPAVAQNDWDTRMFDEMQNMQARMDAAFRDAFPNDAFNGSSFLRLGSTVNVDDQGDKYVVHFTLPRSDMSNVNVKFENGALSLTAREENNSTSNASPGAVSSNESGEYQQMITLPGPVKDSAMQVERKNGGIVVTLPKA